MEPPGGLFYPAAEIASTQRGLSPRDALGRLRPSTRSLDMSKRRLTVFYIDGTKSTFAFPPQVDPITVASAVQDALSKDKLTIAADGVLFMIPLSGVKYVQVHPMPAKLPASVIQGATLVS
jgi:hypothetical protein